MWPCIHDTLNIPVYFPKKIHVCMLDVPHTTLPPHDDQQQEHRRQQMEMKQRATIPKTWPGQDKYKFADPQNPEVLGMGTYGTVFAAVAVRDGQRVAIKRIEGVFDSKRAVTCARREIRLNTRFAERALAGRGRQPVVRMIEAMLDKDDESIYLVFERMDKTLAKLGRLPPDDAIRIARELIRCTAEMHAARVVHRDLKPQNVLASADGEGHQVAICDLGMARMFDDRSTDFEGWTDYVTSRWYRTPEVMCQCRPPSADMETEANAKEETEANAMHADMWSIGCIFAELLYGEPIMKGISEADQLSRIAVALGPMDDATFDWYMRRATDEEKIVPFLCEQGSVTSHIAYRLAKRCSNIHAAINLVCRLLDLMPSRRPTASEALRHPVFDGVSPVVEAVQQADEADDDVKACEPAFPGDDFTEALSQTERNEAMAMLLHDIGISGRKRLQKETERPSGHPLLVLADCCL